MIEKKVECLFSKKIKGDTILQLKNGRLLFYFIRVKYGIRIYNEKSFRQIASINLSKQMEKFEKNKNKEIEVDKSIDKEKDDSDDDEDIKEIRVKNRKLKLFFKFSKKYIYNPEGNCNKNSVKELSNGKIIIGRDKYLFELKLEDNTYKLKVIAKFNDILLDVNELPDQRIIAITNKNIIVFNKEKEEYIIKNEYQIKETWKIIPVSSKDDYYRYFHQYFSSESLPNNRLLLNSFSTEFSYHHGCGTNPPREFSHSKIIFVDINNFKEIKSSELFKIDIKYIIFKKIIVVQNGIYIFIYDINSLELIKTTKLEEG